MNTSLIWFKRLQSCSFSSFKVYQRNHMKLNGTYMVIGGYTGGVGGLWGL